MSNNLEFEIEERECLNPKCPMTFKVWVESPQLFHSRPCEELCKDVKLDRKPQRQAKIDFKKIDLSIKSGAPLRMDPVPKEGVGKAIKEERIRVNKELRCQEAPKVLKEEKPEPVKDPVKPMPQENVTTKPSTPPTQKLSEHKSEPAMKETKKKKPKENDSTELKTKSESFSTNENTMNETKTTSTKSSTPVNAVVIPPEDSTPQSKTALLVESPSMSLLDSTAQHLHGLMKGLTANEPDPSLKRYDPETVQAACSCAKNIREIMKLKLDAIKVQKSLK